MPKSKRGTGARVPRRSRSGGNTGGSGGTGGRPERPGQGGHHSGGGGHSGGDLTSFILSLNPVHYFRLQENVGATSLLNEGSRAQNASLSGTPLFRDITMPNGDYMVKFTGGARGIISGFITGDIDAIFLVVRIASNPGTDMFMIDCSDNSAVQGTIYTDLTPGLKPKMGARNTIPTAYFETGTLTTGLSLNTTYTLGHRYTGSGIPPLYLNGSVATVTGGQSGPNGTRQTSGTLAGGIGAQEFGFYPLQGWLAHIALWPTGSIPTAADMLTMAQKAGVV